MLGPVTADRGDIVQRPAPLDLPRRSALNAGRDQLEDDRFELVVEAPTAA
jgi:hypothetical protein